MNLKNDFVEIFHSKMQVVLGKTVEEASEHDKYVILAQIVREEINKLWAVTNHKYMKNSVKQVYYFSMEFLIGKLLDYYLLYLGIKDECVKGLNKMGFDYESIEAQENEAGLGNGGLGRLAACFLDSMASLGIPGHGCGIRYKYGLFRQKITEGYQVELPDNWLKNQNVWEIRKPDKAVVVKFGGDIRIEDIEGNLKYISENYEAILAVPYDIPILGFGSDNVNTLRLWSAEPLTGEFDLTSFSSGDYTKAREYKNNVEAISEVLYPDDSNYKNRILRLKQEYFFVSAGIQSILRRFKRSNKDLRLLPQKVAIHINDTHPTLAIPEMIRILMDEEGFGWDEAWEITCNTISYTNHTIMSEALEKWPVDIFQRLLPRIHIIVNEINERFCRKLWEKYEGQWQFISDTAIIADGYVRMAHLASVASYSINGVSTVHTELLKEDVLKNFHKVMPDKINNKTNGISLRRWVYKANPPLAKLITDAIGDGWLTHPYELQRIITEKHISDKSFMDQFMQAKRLEKEKLSKYILENYNLLIDTESIFDVQVKRIHAYKRQLLNALHVLHLYNELKENPNLDITPRTFIFAGKAAPSYFFAKKIIRFITCLQETINSDKSVNNKIRIVFLENYNVTLGEMIFPAADISEQISTAGKEASGTGNMKSIANGAVILGSLDGANIEISNYVGEENIITFGLSVGEIAQYYKNGNYRSSDYYENDPRVRRLIDMLGKGCVCNANIDELVEIRKNLIDYNDEFFVLADFSSYVSAQQKIQKLYEDSPKWIGMALNNIAYSGAFGSDETILRYSNEIWKIEKYRMNT